MVTRSTALPLPLGCRNVTTAEHGTDGPGAEGEKGARFRAVRRRPGVFAGWVHDPAVLLAVRRLVMERQLSTVGVATVVLLLTGVVAVGAGAAVGAGVARSAGAVARRGTVAPPLAGRTVVLDPGHQLGNVTHRAQIARRVDAGGFDKPCNTVGAVTDDGYREPTF